MISSKRRDHTNLGSGGGGGGGVWAFGKSGYSEKHVESAEMCFQLVMNLLKKFGAAQWEDR